MCNDKSVATGDGITTSSGSEYGPRDRLKSSSNARPSLLCQDAVTDADANDIVKNISRFTAYLGTDANNGNADNAKGNGKLYLKRPNSESEYRAYKIGLITLDEASFAGAKRDSNYQNYYMYTGGTYWTMSPGFASTSTKVFNWYVTNNGNYYFGSGVTLVADVHPSISLIPTVQITSGNGEVNSPYIIKVN